MPERLAKDIMIPIEEYATVNAEDSLKDAIKVLRNSLPLGHRSLAVLDNKGNLVGFLTIRTILNALEAHAFKHSDYAWSMSWSRFFLASSMERTARIKVREVMRPVIEVFVNENTSLQDVAQTILKNRVNHIPVLNKELKAVGIVRAVDLLDIFGSFLDA